MGEGRGGGGGAFPRECFPMRSIQSTFLRHLFFPALFVFNVLGKHKGVMKNENSATLSLGEKLKMDNLQFILEYIYKYILYSPMCINCCTEAPGVDERHYALQHGRARG